MTYTIYELLCFFVIYSVLGWCLEVCFCTINTGQFVNRGFLNGPVCPIYGFGMVIVLVALTPLAHSLPVLFVGGALLTSALELAAGWILKKVFHTSWWDYSDVPFNLGGYICLKFSLAWGVAVVAVMKGVQPAVAALVRAVPRTLGIVLLCAAGAAFACDLAVTVAGILKLNRDLGHIAEVARLLTDWPRAWATRRWPWTASWMQQSWTPPPASTSPKRRSWTTATPWPAAF